MTMRKEFQISIMLLGILLMSINSFAENLKILHSDYNKFDFHFQLPDVNFQKVQINGQEYSIPIINAAEIIDEPYTPYQLIYKYRINIPNDQTPKLVVSNFVTNNDRLLLAPTPAKIYSRIKDSLKYEINDKYKSEINFTTVNQININEFVKVKYAGIAGDKYIAEIIIYPYLYSTKLNEIIYLQKFDASIQFDDSKSSILNKNIETFNYANALNYNDTPKWNIFYNQTPKLLAQDKPMSELSSGNWVKLSINQQGFYQIEASDLQSLGYNITPAYIQSIKIFGIGGKPLPEDISQAGSLSMNEQEIIVNTNSDGTLRNIVFYGAGPSGFELRRGEIQRYNNYYNSNISYLLTWGGSIGKRAIEQPTPTSQITNIPSTYIDRYLFEEDIVNPYQPGAGRDWFGRSFFTVPFSPVLLHNLDISGSIKYKFALAHHSYVQNENRNFGTFNIYENNTAIGKMVLPPGGEYLAATRGFLNIELPANSISNDDRSIIKIDYNNEFDRSATPYFDYYEIHYPRSLVAINNSINLIPELNQSGVTQYNFNGFNGEIYGFDVTNSANPKLLKNNSSTGGMFVLITELIQNQFANYYISSNLSKPTLAKINIANIRDNQDKSEIVIITHPDLLQSATKYKEYRQSQGYKVSLFRTDDIYNEFACGNNDLTAIRDFLSYLKIKWNGKPDYVILWGDGHYDFKNIATKKTNYIPAYQTYNSDLSDFSEINQCYATDDFYTRLLGNDQYADIRIGRVTIDSPDIGDDVFNKIRNYEQDLSIDQFRTNILLVADDGPTTKDYDGAMHTASSERLQNDIISKYAPELQYEKIYMVEYPSINVPGGRRKPQVTEDLLTKINTSGALILNWFGHGNPRVWAHENILDRDITIPKMINKSKPFFLTAATCDFGRFDNPEVRSGAEEMFVSKNGGAIGTFSATRVVYASENESLAKEFFRILLTKDTTTGLYPTLGEAMLKVKLIKNDENDKKYFLLGDPLIRLAIPDYEIKIKSINNTNLSTIDSTIELKALSEVTVEGYIYSRDGKDIQTDYNGTVTITLRDGDKEISMYEIVDGVQRSFYTFNKLGSSLNQSTYKVENGKFIAKFYIPKDISFSNKNAKLYTFAYSSDKRFAKGVYNQIKISEFDDASSIKDEKGPDITISLDSRKFIDGDIVSSNPLLILDLYDESGINTTGLGIGHRIEAWIDDAKTSIDLTDKFVSSFIDSRLGSVQQVLYNMSEGLHTIKVRAWDVFNNFSLSETKFRIINGSIYLDDLKAFPNPFESETKLYFRHNADLPSKANIEIYTINGQLIRFLQTDINTNYDSEILWDGLDDKNMQVPKGIYIFKVELPNKNNGKIVKFGKVIKIK